LPPLGDPKPPERCSLTVLHGRHFHVARTARVESAKRLLHENDSPMTGIGLRAGFGRLRQFSTVFVEHWQDKTAPGGRLAKQLPTRQPQQTVPRNQDA
jgi:hypothetical protein